MLRSWDFETMAEVREYECPDCHCKFQTTCRTVERCPTCAPIWYRKLNRIRYHKQRAKLLASKGVRA